MTAWLRNMACASLSVQDFVLGPCAVVPHVGSSDRHDAHRPDQEHLQGVPQATQTSGNLQQT
jgi:hypothetical protein